MKYTLTNAGLNLLAKVNAGATLHLTKAKTGSGISATPYDLLDVVSEKQLIQISSCFSEKDKTIIQCVLSNIDVTVSYILKQIGIFALDEFSNTEILFIIGQDEQGAVIPTISENEVEEVYNIAIQVSNAPTVTIDFNRNDFIRKKDFEHTMDTTIADFTEATTRLNIVTGDTVKVILGKIKKFFTDLKTVAFSGSYDDLCNKPIIPSGTAASQAVANNLTTSAAGFVLDARQGKALNESMTAQNVNFTQSVTALNNSLNSGNCVFDYVPDDGLYYNVKVGADTVRKKCSAEIIDCGNISFMCPWYGGDYTFDIKKYCRNYNKLTVSNFSFTLLAISNNQNSTATWNRNFTNSYDKTNGIFKITSSWSSENPVTASTNLTFNVKIIK